MGRRGFVEQLQPAIRLVWSGYTSKLSSFPEADGAPAIMVISYTGRGYSPM